MKFVKAQTNGNDFVIIEEPGSEYDLEFLRFLADRRLGIGCDQIIFVSKEESSYIVEFFNQDGSRAEMCGNGTSALSKYLFLRYNEMLLKLDIANVRYHTEVTNEGLVRIPFSKPKRMGDIISTGNKHIVIESRNFHSIGEANAISKQYPECNIHFIDFLSENTIRVKTFERGVGWTLACGSGAIAVASFSKCRGLVRIIQDGGEAMVDISDDCMTLITNPQIVFEGNLQYREE